MKEKCLEIITKWLSDLEAIEGPITAVKTSGSLVSIRFENGNRYWLRIDKQAEIITNSA